MRDHRIPQIGDQHTADVRLRGRDDVVMLYGQTEEEVMQAADGKDYVGRHYATHGRYVTPLNAASVERHLKIHNIRKEDTVKASPTIEEIKARLQVVETALVEKGIVSPKAELWVRANSPDQVNLWGEFGKNDSLRVFTVKGGDAPAAIDEAAAFVAALPAPEDRAMSEFTRALAAAIEKGRAAGVDDSLVNPLTAMMKKLSENAITHIED